MHFKYFLLALVIGLLTVVIQIDDKLKQTEQELREARIELGVEKVKAMSIKKDLLNDREFCFEVASMYTGIDKTIIKAQATLETGDFTSRRYVDNHNMYGIGVYTNDTEGVIYLNDLQCALHYAKIINDSYDLKGADIHEFEVGIKKWAEDNKYGMKVKSIYYRLMRGE